MQPAMEDNTYFRSLLFVSVIVIRKETAAIELNFIGTCGNTSSLRHLSL